MRAAHKAPRRPGTRPRVSARALTCLLLGCAAGWSVMLHLQLGPTLARAPRSVPTAAPAQRASSSSSSSSTTTAAAREELPAPSAGGGAATGCPGYCHAMNRTELPGDVVTWGDGHRTPTAAACCEACRAKPPCNSWVWCATAACGERRSQCWLKKRPSPWEDVDLLSGQSTLWTSGVLGEPPAAAAEDGGPLARYDFAIVTADGRARVRLRREQAPHAAAFVLGLLADRRKEAAARGGDIDAEDDAAVAMQPGGRPVGGGQRFYRAEPVPPHWGSLDWPDSWSGGRWGPPYSLLQGSLQPQGSSRRVGEADRSQTARPVIRRGMLAFAGGAGGPDFFIALAKHPEWGNGHTVFAEVLPEDMRVIDAIMRRPLRVANWGSINATELVTPVPFRLAPAPGVAAS